MLDVRDVGVWDSLERFLVYQLKLLVYANPEFLALQCFYNNDVINAAFLCIDYMHLFFAKGLTYCLNNSVYPVFIIYDME